MREKTNKLSTPHKITLLRSDEFTVESVCLTFNYILTSKMTEKLIFKKKSHK